MLGMGKNKKPIAVVLYPGMTALDVVGSLETLIILNVRSPYKTVTVGERCEPIQTDTPLKMIPNKAFWEVPGPSVLVVPGGGTTALEAGRDGALSRYVQSAAATAELVVSIGTGSLILAAAGLLEGRRATTHWEYARQLEALGVAYTRERWVMDGKFITAAGVTAGIDMSLHLLAKLTSESRARQSQLVIEYDPQPPFGGIDWDQVDQKTNGSGLIAAQLGDEGAQHSVLATSALTEGQV